MGYWQNSQHRDTLVFRTGENPHLRPKPVNTRPKTRLCGEIKHVQFKKRTNDRRLLAYSLIINRCRKKLNAEGRN
ncbi:hypothetical protein Hanom_Chr16g01479231 [Helianthus anomalus]